MDEDTGGDLAEVTGSIDQVPVIFDEGLSVANSFFFSFSSFAKHITTN